MARYGKGGDVPHVLNTATLDNALYMGTEQNELYKWDAQNNKITPLSIENGSGGQLVGDRLVTDGETLYRLDCLRGTLFPLHLAGDTVTMGEGIALNWSRFSDSSYVSDVRKLFFFEGKLYMVTAGNDYDADWRERSLYRFDVEKHSCTLLYRGIDMADVSPWRDGKLAMAVFDMGRSYRGVTDEALWPAVKAFDPESKTHSETLFTHETRIGGLAYDEKADAFFFCAGGMLLKRAARAAETEHINYVPPPEFDEFMQGVLIHPDCYALYTNGGIFIRSTLPEDKPTTVLRVGGIDLDMMCPDGYSAFLRKYPEMPLVLDTNNYFNSAEAIYVDMLTDTASDIYCVTDTDTLETLARKGYCYDLGESAALKAATEGMYPHLSAPLYQGDKLCAVPVFVGMLVSYTYSPSLLNRVGLTEADLPRTMMELIDFVVRWVEEISVDYFGLKLFRDQDLPAREMLLSMIFGQQAAQCAKQGIPMAFDTPEMRALLKRLDEVAPILARLDEAEADLSGGYFSHSSSEPVTALFSQDSLFISNFSENDDYTALNLRYTDEAEWIHMVSVTTLIVNPKTKNKEYAVTLLEEVAANISMHSRIFLYPNANEPIEDPRWMKLIEEIQSDIITYKEQMDGEQDASKKREWEDALKSMERTLANYERFRYRVTSEQIAAYRAVAENMIPYVSAFAGSENLINLLRRYSDGQIGADQYITESERIISMMTLENQ